MTLTPSPPLPSLWGDAILAWLNFMLIILLKNLKTYSKVSNRRGVEQQGWLEKISKANSRRGGGVEIVGKGWEKLEVLIAGGGFFLSFFNHENYSIKNICIYSKSKIKTKVTSKQNPEHFKMINKRLFIHKFCNNLKMLLSSSWAKYIRALVFSSSPRANFLLGTCVFRFYYFFYSFLFSSQE